MLGIGRLIAVRNYRTSPLRCRARTLFGGRDGAGIWVVSYSRTRTAIGCGGSGVSSGGPGVWIVVGSSCCRSVRGGNSLRDTVGPGGGIVVSGRRSIFAIGSVRDGTRIVHGISIG